MTWEFLVPDSSLPVPTSPSTGTASLTLVPSSPTWQKCTPDCGSFTGSEGTPWFKVHQMGYASKWATQVLFNQANTWYTTIPACLEPGEYLVRHEIISLSECKTVGQCQFYPSCHQVKVVVSHLPSSITDKSGWGLFLRFS